MAAGDQSGEKVDGFARNCLSLCVAPDGKAGWRALWVAPSSLAGPPLARWAPLGISPDDLAACGRVWAALASAGDCLRRLGGFSVGLGGRLRSGRRAGAPTTRRRLGGPAWPPAAPHKWLAARPANGGLLGAMGGPLLSGRGPVKVRGSRKTTNSIEWRRGRKATDKRFACNFFPLARLSPCCWRKAAANEP